MARWYFLISLLAVMFIWGFVSHAQKFFPYQIIQQAVLAFDATFVLKSSNIPVVNVNGEDILYPIHETSGLTAPTAISYASSVPDDNIFILGSEYLHRDICGQVGCLAVIVNRKGEVLHAWRNHADLWELSQHDKGFFARYFPTRAKYFPNGDILVNYAGFDTFPYPVGLAKFDKDSRLIWKRENLTHHEFTTTPEGRIITPGMDIVDSPVIVADRQLRFVCEEGRLPWEYIGVLDPMGNPAGKIDLMSVFKKSQEMSHFYVRGFNDLADSCDAFHLNSIDYLTEDEAAQFSRFHPGDFLVSLRAINFVGVIDARTQAFAWTLTGPTIRQHSAKFWKDNKILVFDNLGGTEAAGTTRIVSVDTLTDKLETLFPRSGQRPPADDFRSHRGGVINLHPDGNRILAAFAYPGGYLWEIDLRTGAVLWEYRNVEKIADQTLRFVTYMAEYATDIRFELNHGRLPAAAGAAK